jgi:hypothetical protein
MRCILVDAVLSWAKAKASILKDEYDSRSSQDYAAAILSPHGQRTSVRGRSSANVPARAERSEGNNGG